MSTGRITGTARVMTDPNDPSALEPGDILIAPDAVATVRAHMGRSRVVLLDAGIAY